MLAKEIKENQKLKLTIKDRKVVSMNKVAQDYFGVDKLGFPITDLILNFEAVLERCKKYITENVVYEPWPEILQIKKRKTSSDKSPEKNIYAEILIEFSQKKVSDNINLEIFIPFEEEFRSTETLDYFARRMSDLTYILQDLNTLESGKIEILKMQLTAYNKDFDTVSTTLIRSGKILYMLRFVLNNLRQFLDNSDITPKVNKNVS